MKNPKQFCNVLTEPQKQKVINGDCFWQKNNVRGVFQWENEGNFLVQNKKIYERKNLISFNIIWLTQVKNEKFRLPKPTLYS